MNGFQKLIAFLGRACFSAIFIFAGISKIFNWDASEQMLVNQLLEMVSQSFQSGWAQFVVDKVIPIAPTLFVISTVFEILGGVLVFFGIQVRLGAFLLMIFLIPSTIVMHGFWMLEGADRPMQMIMFMKNLSMFGGTLILLAFGKGPREPKKAK